MILSNLPDSVTVRRPGSVTDRYGNVSESWSAATSSVVRGWLQASDSSELSDEERDASRSTFRLFLAPGTVVRSADRVVVGGVTYEVVGDPLVVHGLRARPGYVRVSVRRVVG